MTAQSTAAGPIAQNGAAADTEPSVAQTQAAETGRARHSPIEWVVEPHLIGNRLLAIGRSRGGARINNVLSDDGTAFDVYRDGVSDELPGEVVLIIVPRRNDGITWAIETEQGVPIITAHEYDTSGGRFILYADTADLLPDERRHTLRVWGAMPDSGPRLLAEPAIGRYVHRRLPQVSLGSVIRRWLAALWRRFLWLGIVMLVLILLALSAIGAVVVIDPSWMGLEYIEEVNRFFDWLPWR